MQAIVERAAGLDVHQASVVACVLIGRPGERPHQELRHFGTMTADLEALRDWLKGLGVTHVGMESTGIYWMPVFALLEGHFTLIVANARHIKNVPGRKTDVKDAVWIADLVRHGLVNPSFVPPPEIRELRDLVRFRRTLAETLAKERNRTLKLLETANIKLASVATDVFGVSGMAMLKALLDGTMSPEGMAELAKGRLRAKREPLTRALHGRLPEHHRFLLGLQLRRLEEIERDLSQLEARIAQAMAPFRRQQDRLKQIPGIDAVAAAGILAEIGIDMSVFGSARRLAAWAGVCPGNHESAGRQKKGTTRKGNLHLKATLMTAAVGVARTRGTFYKEKYYRLKPRLGAKRAAMAIAHKILVAVFHMLSRDTAFHELGAAHLDQQHKHRVAKGLVRRLGALGYDVLLRPKQLAT